MAEYIDLNNTEVLAEAGENAKLVVEEDGELKRIPASAVGQVKTVNGVEPDEAGNVGVSYNNLLDKPFGYGEERLVEIVPEMTIPEYSTPPIIDMSFLEGGRSYVVTVNGVQYTSVCESGNSTFLGNGYGCASDDWEGGSGEPFYFVFRTDGSGMLALASYPSTISIATMEREVIPLDAKFLPTTVPVIQSATVGQTVVVKAVDESGKPTAWEAVDMSVGGDGNKTFVIITTDWETYTTTASYADIAALLEAAELPNVYLKDIASYGNTVAKATLVAAWPDNGNIHFHFASPDSYSMPADLWMMSDGTIVTEDPNAPS